jgi:hypothetical protein
MIRLEHITELPEKVALANELPMNEDGLSCIAGSGIPTLGVLNCAWEQKNKSVMHLPRSQKPWHCKTRGGLTITDPSFLDIVLVKDENKLSSVQIKRNTYGTLLKFIVIILLHVSID